MEYIEDRLVKPYVVWEHRPTGIKYVDFPILETPPDNTAYYMNLDYVVYHGVEPEYQRRRYYSDERPMTLEDFNKLRKQEN